MLFQSDAKVSSVLQLTITDFSPESSPMIVKYSARTVASDVLPTPRSP